MRAGLYAIQHIRRMRGGSQAHLLRASDGAFYVTKFQNNPQHLRVLANEMLASRLGQWLGLPVPRVEVIEVSDWLITHTQDLKVEVGSGAVPRSSDKQLASLYPPLEAQIFDYLPESMLLGVANLTDFARSLVLDKWTANSDGRQAIFVRQPGARRYRASLCCDLSYVAWGRLILKCFISRIDCQALRQRREMMPARSCQRGSSVLAGGCERQRMP